jgi:PAS domain S-box-containing protein
MRGWRGASGFSRELLYTLIVILLAFILPALLVLRAWDAELQKVESESRADFEARATQIRDALADRLRDYEQVLRGAAGLFAASESVSRNEWRAYHGSLKLETYYPGIQGIGFAPRLLLRDKSAFVRSVRTDGISDYEISPDGIREEYFPIQFLEPFSGRNLRAIGYDMNSDAVRSAAIVEAIASGRAAISGKVRLVQETDQNVQPGFLMYVPIYHQGSPADSYEERTAAARGVVFAAFRAGDLISRILGENQRLDVAVYDGTRATEDALLYRTMQSEISARSPKFSYAVHILINGSPWSLKIHSSPAFEAGIDSGKSRLVLLGGGAMHLLLLAVLWSLWNTRRRALAIAGQMTREVRHREAEWQAMSDASPLGIFRADAEGAFTYVNPRYERLSGLTAAAAMGSGWLDAVHAADRERVSKRWRALVKGEEPEAVTTYRFLRDGKEQIWVTALTGVIREDDEITGYVGVVEDVTERKAATDALLESRERLGMALEGSNLALFDWDIPSGEVRLSEQWQLMMGGDNSETVITFAELQQLAHPDDLARLQQSLQPVLKGSARFYEVQHRVRNRLGEWRWIHSRAKVSERDERGNALRMTGTNADITAMKEVERLKNEFISTVSHELRTPLTAIIGALGLVSETASGLDPDAAQFIEMAYLNSERLSALINDVLDVEKLDSGQMTLDLRPLPLREILEHAVRINQPYAAMHHASLRLLPGPEFTVSADHDRLLQVLTNLISNAAKFSPEGGEVTISAEQRGSVVRVAVRDHGPGIPENFRAAVFHRFERADNSDTRKKGGTGLGLSICKALVERMNWEIGFDSEPGKGSTFYFELPLQP